MLQLNYGCFKNTVPVPNGVYVFVSDTCEICKMYEKELSLAYGHVTQDWTLVETLLETDKEHLRVIAPEFKACPFTAVFQNGVPVFQRNGALFASQIRQALECENVRNLDSLCSNKT